MPKRRSGTGVDRRTFMGLCTAVGLGGGRLPAALWSGFALRGASVAAAQGPATPPKIGKDALIAAEAVAGLEFTDAERDMMLEDLNGALAGYAQIRAVSLKNSVLPALRFDPVLPAGRPGTAVPSAVKRAPRRGPSAPAPNRPASPEDLAFIGVAQLSALYRAGRVSSVELTELAIDRLKRFDKDLLCVVNLTEERALRQARAADEERKRGKLRGPLHGIPWGAKDLLAVPGYPTTWGSPIYKDQVLEETATVVERLDAAGAVLVAKLSLGEFAQGDVWFGGTTKNPWKIDQGSSGSSAGPGSATAAGCVPFAIGTETLGSIISPSTRCGITGLRPTFGRVSRHGAMALSWSMDKIGPMCRSATDAGLVFGAIHGPDGKDPTCHDRPFNWAPSRGIAGLRIGYFKTAFEAEHATKAFDSSALEVLRGMGAELIPVALPTDIPIGPLRIILSAEAAAAFDEITRTNADDRMVRQNRGAWPNSFRVAHFIPAVEYIQANRIRSLLMQKLEAMMEPVDVFVTPTNAPQVLLATNLSGHPALAVPNGFTPDGTPVSLSFIGRLFGEAELLAVGEAYQAATNFHTRRPARFG